MSIMPNSYAHLVGRRLGRMRQCKFALLQHSTFQITMLAVTIFIQILTFSFYIHYHLEADLLPQYNVAIEIIYIWPQGLGVV